jgi:acyl-CoA thioesterase I
MYSHTVLRRAAVIGVIATASLVAFLPAASSSARAQVGAANAAVARAPAAAVAPRAPACVVAPSEAHFDFPLPRTARRLANGEPIKIVALGSSSTYGAGASTSAAAYPSRLAEELARQFPGHEFVVLNRGVSGEEVTDMLARLDTAVLAEKPDLVLWQVGTNSVLRDHALEPHVGLLHEGITRLKATGADVVLIDPQYAPKVIAKPDAERMVTLISATAKREGIDLFRRFDVMRHWHDVDQIGFETFVSPDGLHMNDWSYACMAKGLGNAIAEAAQRPLVSATAAPVR